MATSRKKSAFGKEINGAVMPSSYSSSHQTHGGYTPINGPVLTVQQLVRGPNISRSSIGSFETAAAYVSYLKTLSTAELHRHAVDEAHIVAIDDRDRLIKRLEVEWTGINAREATGGMNKHVPKSKPFTPEQHAEQAEIRKKLLGAKG